MAPAKAAPAKAAASGGGLDRRRNQPGRQKGEETGHNSTGHGAHPTPRSVFHIFGLKRQFQSSGKKARICDIHHIADAAVMLVCLT